MNKKSIAIALTAILAVSGVGYTFLHPQNARTDLVLQGNVDIREVDLAFRQAGRIASLKFEEGTTVKAGDLLAELDATPFLDALALADANQAQAVADLEKINNGSRAQEIAQADATMRQSKAALAEAEQNYTRQMTLAKTGAASERTLEAARSTRDQARATLAATEQEWLLRKEGSRKEDIAAAKARLRAANAQVAQAETALSDTRLLAPSDGLISARVREPGSMVTSSAPVYTLSIQDPIYVRAYVSQPQLIKVQPGSHVIVKADGSDETFTGTVGFISPKAEFTPKSVETTELRTDLVYRIRVVLPASAKALRQGMPVTVVVDESAAQ